MKKQHVYSDRVSVTEMGHLIYERYIKKNWIGIKIVRDNLEK